MLGDSIELAQQTCAFQSTSCLRTGLVILLPFEFLTDREE